MVLQPTQFFRPDTQASLLTRMFLLRFPSGISGKEPACQCRRHKKWGFDPWIEEIPWKRAWQPTPVVLPTEIPWTERPGGPQSIGSQRVSHSWSDLAHTHVSTDSDILCSRNFWWLWHYQIFQTEPLLTKISVQTIIFSPQKNKSSVISSCFSLALYIVY